MRLSSILLLVLACLTPAAAVAGVVEPDPSRDLEQIVESLEAEAEGLEDDGAPLPERARRARLEARLARLEAHLARSLDGANQLAVGLFGPEAGRLDVAATGPLPEATAAITVLAEQAPDTGLVHRFVIGWSRLQDTVARLRALRGALRDTVDDGRVCPVAGPHSFEDTWGEARAWARTHKGTDMHAERGTPLVAIESGTVTQADWHWAGGRGLYIEGSLSGDVYYYAHLDGYAPGIAPGAEVTAGEPVGWLGWTGNAETAHLHLGWIPGGGVLAELANPYGLLVLLCE